MLGVTAGQGHRAAADQFPYPSMLLRETRGRERLCKTIVQTPGLEASGCIGERSLYSLFARHGVDSWRGGHGKETTRAMRVSAS